MLYLSAYICHKNRIKKSFVLKEILCSCYEATSKLSIEHGSLQAGAPTLTPTFHFQYCSIQKFTFCYGKLKPSPLKIILVLQEAVNILHIFAKSRFEHLL